MYHGHLTSGVISGINRLFTPVNDLDERQYLFQIDTPVNPGNSGGPLFNALGKVIGINSSKLLYLMMINNQQNPFHLPSLLMM